MTSRISAEAQHLIDSLESHLVAVKAAVAGAEPGLVEHAQEAWDDVLVWLDALEAKFRGSAGKAASDIGAVATANTAGFAEPDGSASAAS